MTEPVIPTTTTATPATTSAPAVAGERVLHVSFCAWYVAGVRTQYENVRAAAATEPDIRMRYVEINPHKPGGLVERLPLLGERTRGSIRSLLCTAPLYSGAPLDAVWTQADTALYLFSQTAARLRRIPYVLSTDATTAQVESMPEYGMGDGSRLTRAKHLLRDGMAAAVYRGAAYVLPWSRWAAEAIQRQYGIPEQRVVVVPPGVDLAAWPTRRDGWANGAGSERPARILFVGGDWERKGGPLLLDAFQRLKNAGTRRCELHLVTRDAPAGTADPAGEGVYVYDDMQPNDPRLLHLYQTCDVMVLPTLADCFSLASIEAMAAGMPVIVTNVGGIPDIIADGESGYLIEKGDASALHTALSTLLADPARMERMGRRGRAIVEQRFDARQNARQVFDLLRKAVPAR